MPGKEDTHFRFLGCGFTLMRLSLPKIRDGFGRSPEGIVQSSIKPWSAVNAYSFRYTRPFLRDGAGRVLTGTSYNTPRRKEHGNKNNYEHRP